ncbi:MAG TPA: molybdopterin-dependent oxidoreductase [Thermoleophilia bacterium]
MSQDTARKSLIAAEASCVSCGVCTDACDVLGQERLAIGEVASRVLEGTVDDSLTGAVSRCSLCGLCCAECPANVDSKEVMTAAREEFVSSGALSALGYEHLFTGCGLNVFTDYKKAYSISYEDLKRQECDVVFFPGCALSAYSPELVRRVHGWLEGQGASVGVIDSCCGTALICAGLPDRARESRARLAEEIAAAGAGRLITACPDCFCELSGRLEGIEVVSLSSLLRERGVRVSGAERLTVHDSCPDRASLTVGGDVRAILSGYELVEMEHFGKNTICCGSGGLVSSVDPELCDTRARTRVEEFRATGAVRLVTSCVNCAHRLNGAAGAGEVLHYLELVFDVWIDWVDVNEMLVTLSDGERGDEVAPTPSVSVMPTNCRFCGYLCALEATVEDGHVLWVAPDPARFPYDERIQNGCARWRATVEILEHPDRVNYPLKRVGARGSGEWERVSWEEALDDIANRLTTLAEEFGPEVLATSIGGPHATYWPLHRFLNLFGSPNNVGIGQICWNPGIWINTLTFGWPIEPDFDPEVTGALMLWGTNPAESDNSAFWRAIREFSKSELPLIVVDPRKTRTASRADLWLPVRPGTDCTLALGLINVVIEQDLYDHEFVEAWCHGFEQLAEHVMPYTPDAVSRITGVPASNIVAAARLFAISPASALVSGRGIDQLGPNTAPTHRALAILRTITGNVDRPGSSVLTEMPDFTPEVELELSNLLSASQRAKHLNRGRLILQTPEGYDRVRVFTERAGKRLPMRYLTSTQPDLVWEAMLKGDPYPIRAMIVMGSNPLLTQADSKRVHAALSSLDLLVVLEYYKTPTAMLADYILPAAGGLERPLFQTHAGTSNIAYGGDAAVRPYYERRTDYFFWRELGRRLGQEEYWPQETLIETLAATLAPAGVTWEEFSRTGLYHVAPGYEKHERVDPATGAAYGFATPSGQVELYSDLLEELGYEPLPAPKTLPAKSEEFPLTLLTGARKQPFYASSYHQVSSLAKLHPEPLAEMSQTTVAGLGLEDGDAVMVSTERGSARFVVKTTEMVEGAVSVEYGWWYPGQDAKEPHLSGTWTSNANMLTSSDIETSDPFIGTWTYNGVPCRVNGIQVESARTSTDTKEI